MQAENQGQSCERLLDGFLTLAELAEEFGVHPETVKRWNRQGKGPPKVMIGRFPYYSKSGVRAWMQKRANAA